MKTKKRITSLAVFLLIVLFSFLPFSSWLVSITGMPSISLARDVLAVLIFIIGLINLLFFKEKIKNKGLIIFSLLFIIWGLLSFFWKEASPLQWLRGLRFAFIPILLLISLQLFNFSKDQRRRIYRSVFLSSVIVIILATLEFFNVKIPLTSELSTEGALTTIHAVGTKFIRLQGVLAGPNALGLYLLSSIAFLIIASSFISRRVIYLVPIFVLASFFTFSRSSWIGMIILFLTLLHYFLRKKYSYFAVSSWVASFILLMSLTLWFGYQSNSLNSLITHGASSTKRVEQYKRIWDQKYEIGFLGRGMGAAGPSSQNRLDRGPNYWTENSYLDTFEETGFVGLILFLLLFFTLGHTLYEKIKSREGKVAFSLLLSFAVAGLFINIYTGQAGLYLLILASGLAAGGENVKNTD